jgi:CHAT domain-containing protein/tetratricopeptide (TPR) repeat protein
MSALRGLLRIVLLASLISCNETGRDTRPPQALTPAPERPLPPTPPQRLSLGSHINANLGPGERRSFLVALTPGHALRLAVEQENLDLVVEVFDPAGRQTLEVDSPIGPHGPEIVCFVAAGTGSHRIDLHPLNRRRGGSFTIQTAPLRRATSADRTCMEATRTFAEAEQHWEDAARKGTSAPSLVQEYEMARKLWREAGERFQESFVLAQMGKRWSELGYVSKAISYYREALSDLRAVDDGRWQEVVLLNRLGGELRLLGELQKAEISLQVALRLARELKDQSGEATALNNLALLMKTRGDIYQAIDNYRQARALYKNLREPAAEAVALHNLGVSLTFLGRYQEALDFQEDALQIQLRLHLEAAQAATLTSIGWTRYLMGDNRAALDSFRKAIDLSQRAGRRSEEAAALDRMATTYRKLGRPSEALEAYQNALGISEELGNRRDEAHTLANLGWLRQEHGQFLTAQTELKRSLTLFRKIGDQEGLAYALVGLAQAERGLGRSTLALQRMEEALSVVEKLRAYSLRQGSQPEADPFWQEYTDLYIDLLMELHSTHPALGLARRAFETSDLARARSLVGLLEESRLGLRSGVPAALLEEERILQNRLDTIEDHRMALLAMSQPPPGELSVVDRSLRESQAEYQDLQRAIRVRSPRFADLRNPRPVSLSTAQRMLDPETLLLSYVLGEKRSFLFVLGAGSFQAFVLPERIQIEALARAVYKGFLQNRGAMPKSQMQLASATLGGLLLPPAVRQSGKRRLLIVADGLLHYIPFAALPTSSNVVGSALFIENFQFSYLPSVAALDEMRRRRMERRSQEWPVATKLLGVVADPVFSLEDERWVAVGGRAQQSPSPTNAAKNRVGFNRLPFTRREAESILRLVPPAQRREALGFDANLALVRSGTLADCAILHFATHAVLNEEHPQFSEVVLSLIDRKGRPLDGHLRLQEIYTLRLAADLVVLSACSTALGQEVRGDGLVGLTRGFAYAGASRLVVSLWDVNDAATAELMAHFYRGVLQQGLPPALALHEAQIWLRSQKRWQAPYYWAPFVLQGDWR